MERKDVNIKCPKCKKPLKRCDHHMMGIDKKCFDCHVNWTRRTGFKSYPDLSSSV